MRSKLLAASVMVFLLPATAQAIDLPSKPKTQPKQFTTISWTGPYIGTSVGISQLYATMTGNDNYYFGNDKMAASGFGSLVGGTFGYNYQIGADFVAGLEVDLSLAKVGGSSSYYRNETTLDTTLGFMSSLRGRLGWLIGPNTLPYIIIGVAYANVKTAICGGGGCDGSSTNFETGHTGRDDVVGYLAGAGVEHALDDNWRLRAETIYFNLGRSHYVTVADASYFYNVANSGVEARLGLNYQFGRDSVSSHASSSRHVNSNYSWTGPYIGATAGIIQHGSTLSGHDGKYIDAGDQITAIGYGRLIGATLGYNFQIGSSYVAGIEADFSSSNTSGGSSIYWKQNTTSFRSNAIGSLRGRFGTVLNGDTLVYTTLGVAYANVKSAICQTPSYQDPPSGYYQCDGSATNSDYGHTGTDNLVGYMAGTGVEHAFDGHWRLKAEALYYDLGSSHYVTRSDAQYFYNVTNSGASTRLGLNYAF